MILEAKLSMPLLVPRHLPKPLAHFAASKVLGMDIYNCSWRGWGRGEGGRAPKLDGTLHVVSINVRLSMHRLPIIAPSFNHIFPTGPLKYNCRTPLNYRCSTLLAITAKPIYKKLLTPKWNIAKWALLFNKKKHWSSGEYPHMTTGFCPFKLQKVWEHSLPKSCFEESSSWHNLYAVAIHKLGVKLIRG